MVDHAAVQFVAGIELRIEMQILPCRDRDRLVQEDEALLLKLDRVISLRQPLDRVQTVAVRGGIAEERRALEGQAYLGAGDRSARRGHATGDRGTAVERDIDAADCLAILDRDVAARGGHISGRMNHELQLAGRDIVEGIVTIVRMDRLTARERAPWTDDVRVVVRRQENREVGDRLLRGPIGHASFDASPPRHRDRHIAGRRGHGPRRR